MSAHDADFVCGLLVDFADGRAGRSELVQAGSRKECLQAAYKLVGRDIAGNRLLLAAHVVILAREEWDDFYSDLAGRVRDKAFDAVDEAAMTASRTSLELITSLLRASLPARDAAEAVATAFIRRGTYELVNQLGKEQTAAILSQALEQNKDQHSDRVRAIEPSDA